MTPNHAQIIDAVTSLLSTTAAETSAFAQVTRLRCKSGCGRCCENPHIETTVTEMMPLAAHLQKSGEVEAIIARLEAEETCVAYQPQVGIEGNGRCGYYEYRPGICRLFGFSAKKDKQQERKLVTCRVMKEEFPGDCQNAQAYLDKDGIAPNISNYTMNVYAIDPQWGNKLMPINKALRIALEIIN